MVKGGIWMTSKRAGRRTRCEMYVLVGIGHREGSGRELTAEKDGLFEAVV